MDGVTTERFMDREASFGAVPSLTAYILMEQKFDSANEDAVPHDGCFHTAIRRHQRYVEGHQLDADEAQIRFVGLFVNATRLAMKVVQVEESEDTVRLKKPRLFEQLPEIITEHIENYFEPVQET